MLNQVAAMVWPFGGRCRSSARLDNKTAVVTGSNTGIGKETAFELASRGARVILAVRDTAKGEAAAADIRSRLAEGNSTTGPRGEVRVEKLDLASLRSVRECARRILEQEKSLHILVNNAGLAQTHPAFTEDGHEMQFGVSHLGHFLLTALLLPRMRASAADSDNPSRIVSLTSTAYMLSRIDFDDLHCKNCCHWLMSYGRSKLATMLFTQELARRAKEAPSCHVASYCSHPGVVSSDLFRQVDNPFLRFGVCLLRVFMKNPNDGAQTSVHCAVAEETAKESGLFYMNCSPTTPFAIGRDEEAARRLWDVSLELVGLKGYDPTTAAEAPAWAFQQPTAAAS